jgi:uncharacterized membrane protein
MDFSPEALRAHFQTLTAQRAAIDVKLDPLRDELDELMQNDKLPAGVVREREAGLREQIRSLQNELAPIEQERAAVARALNGKTSEAVNV